MKLSDRLKLAAFYAGIAAAIALGGFLYSGPILADEPGLYLELGAGMNYSVDLGPRSIPQSVIRLRYEMANRQWWKPDVLEYNHHSSITEGRPFNDRPEDLTDQASIIWRFKLR